MTGCGASPPKPFLHPTTALVPGASHPAVAEAHQLTLNWIYSPGTPQWDVELPTPPLFTLSCAIGSPSVVCQAGLASLSELVVARVTKLHGEVNNGNELSWVEMKENPQGLADLSRVGRSKSILAQRKTRSGFGVQSAKPNSSQTSWGKRSHPVTALVDAGGVNHSRGTER